ncbi:MAG: YcxB family protein [Clostridia bacterium]|nr:YcxB family protein [Clostridia bacterium]
MPYFKFDVNLSEQDYLDYNKFWMIKSPYGKKQILNFRIILTVILGLISLLSLFGGKFSADAFIGIIPYLVLLVVFQLALNPIFVWVSKAHIKSLKKQGKMGYSPVSAIEFYENGFTETTPDNKTEQKYSSVERISVINNKVIYIHVNNIMSYILPFSCFDSKEQYTAFFQFIKTKCSKIDMY